MSEITRVGVDLAKSVIKVHGVDAAGKVVTNRQLPRDKFMAWCVQLPPGCPIAMEASSGAHHWARKLAGFGLEPRCAVCIWVRAGDKPVQKHRLQMCSLILVLPQLQVTQMQEYRSSRKKCKYRYPMLDYLGSPCRGGLEANLFIISGSFEIQPLPNGLTASICTGSINLANLRLNAHEVRWSGIDAFHAAVTLVHMSVPRRSPLASKAPVLSIVMLPTPYSLQSKASPGVSAPLQKAGPAERYPTHLIWVMPA